MSFKDSTILIRKNFFLLLLFGVMAISLLSPLASNVYLPECPEFPVHVSNTIQAKNALEQGQFPIRTTADQASGFGVPWFQFHSPLPYTISGVIYKLVAHTNPYIALKLTLWLGMLLATFYIYRLTSWLVKSESIAIVAAAVYVMSPYFLINLVVRGDFTETIAQCIVPMAVYYTLRLYDNQEFNSRYFILNAISWFALITSCVVTYVYTSVFLGLLLIFISYKNQVWLKKLFFTGSAYLFGIILSSFFIIPIALTEKYLQIDNSFSYFELSFFLTPLSTLLSIAAISPVPLPGNSMLSYPIYLSVGLPITLAIGASIYSLYKKIPFNNSLLAKLAIPLLILFFLAFFTVWTPFNFWIYLPKVLTMAQFSYRLLTQTMWIGAILFAFSLYWLFGEKFDARHTIVGLLLISICSSTWLYTPKSGKKVQDIIQHPDTGYGANYFSTDREKLNLPYMNNSHVSIASGDNWLITNKKIRFLRSAFPKDSSFMLHIEGNVPSVYKAPVMVKLRIDDAYITSKELAPGDFKWDLPIGENISKRNAKYVDLQFSSKQYFIPMKLTTDEQVGFATDPRHLTVKITKSDIVSTMAPSASELSLIPVSAIRNACDYKGKYTKCNITVPAGTHVVQLPVSYYPYLLNIKVDGKQVSYQPTVSGYTILAGVELSEGSHAIKSYFQGVWWANWMSALAWFAIFLIAGREMIKLLRTKN